VRLGTETRCANVSMSLAPVVRLSRACFRSSPRSRRFSSRTTPSPSFPVVPSCPAATCSCAASPPLPEGLEIDRESPLNGVITSYYEHVLVCTGKEDWPSRIEEDNSGDNLAADLKELLGRGGVYSDVCYYVDHLVMDSALTPVTAFSPHLYAQLVLPAVNLAASSRCTNLVRLPASEL